MQGGKYLERNIEFLELANPLDLVVRKLLIPILFLFGAAGFFLGINYPLLPLAVILFLFLCASSGAFWLIKKGWFSYEVIYFILLLVDAVLLTFAVYFSGGIESPLFMIFGIIGVLAGLTLPRWGILGVIAVSISLYFTELALEIYQAIPHVIIFPEFIPASAYFHSYYLRIIPFAIAISFLAVTLISFFFAEILRKRKTALAKLHQEIDVNSQLLIARDQELTSLNKRLDEKIRELEEAKAGLEKNIAERTADLKIKVAELEKTENSLRESEAKSRALLNTLPDLMFLQTKDGVFLDYFANDLKDLYVSPSEFIGKNMRAILPPELAESFASLFEKTLRTKEVQVLEYALPIGGEINYYESRMIALGEDKIVSVVRNITERKSSEKKLQETAAELQEFHDLAVGRELKMIELEKENGALLKELGREPEHK